MNNYPQKKILVLDGEQRSSLATVRSLGRQGLNIFVGSTKKRSLSGSSRYALKEICYQDPLLQPLKFVDNLKEVISREAIDILLPMTDASVYVVLMNEKKFRNIVKIPFPEFDSYVQASDKYMLIKRAQSLKIPTPETIFIHPTKNITDLITSINYPVVLKPRSSILKINGRYIRAGVEIVYSAEELHKVLQEKPCFRHHFMIQEKLDGEGLGVFTLCKRGTLLAVFSHRRLREKPPWGGVSVLSESIEPDAKAKEFAIKLLENLKWSGVAMVEFKRDKRDGIPKLMEINARLWGSLQLAIDAGIDFPHLLYLQSQGFPLPKVHRFDYARLRWLLGDIDNLYITLKGGRADSRLSGLYESLPTSLFNFFKEFHNRSRFQVLRSDDLRPFLRELQEYIYAVFK